MGVDPPVDFAAGEVSLEQAQDRQRLHHIAKRTGLENEDLHRAPSRTRGAATVPGAQWGESLLTADTLGPTAQKTKGFTALTAEGDRKSTRLNSSHLGISYAVF